MGLGMVQHPRPARTGEFTVKQATRPWHGLVIRGGTTIDGSGARWAVPEVKGRQLAERVPNADETAACMLRRVNEMYRVDAVA